MVDFTSKILADFGVRQVYLLAGSSTMFLNYALGTNPKIKPILNLHEQACSIAVQAKISMDGRGRARDQIFTERQWSDLKYDKVCLHEYITPKETYRGLSQYIYFQDYERPHQSLDHRTCTQYYDVSLPVVNSTCQVEPVETNTSQYTLTCRFS